MKKAFLSLALVALMGGYTHAASAAIAIPSCEVVEFTPEQRASMAEIVFEGHISMATCKCMPLATDGDYDGPEVECTDIIEAEKPIKGIADPQYTIESLVMLSIHPDKKLSHWECKDRVSDRNSKLKDEDKIFYLRHNAEGFIESVPKSGCR